MQWSHSQITSSDMRKACKWTYKVFNSLSVPMSALSVPLMPMADSFLKFAKIRLNLVKTEEETSFSFRKDAHRIVTLELLHDTPSQGVPQGSSVVPQLGGVFCHSLIRDRRAAAAKGKTRNIWFEKHTQETSTPQSLPKRWNKGKYHPQGLWFPNWSGDWQWMHTGWR